MRPAAMPDPTWFREIDHTGDVGIAVEAEDLPTLFARAARGMFSVLTDVSEVKPRESQKVAVEAPDLDALLVQWLSELNFRHVTEGWLFSEYQIQELSEKRLVAVARGEPVDPECHTVYTEIKAVTYHGLDVREDEEGWHAQIIFDM